MCTSLPCQKKKTKVTPVDHEQIQTYKLTRNSENVHTWMGIQVLYKIWAWHTRVASSSLACVAYRLTDIIERGFVHSRARQALNNNACVRQESTKSQSNSRSSKWKSSDQNEYRYVAHKTHNDFPVVVLIPGTNGSIGSKQLTQRLETLCWKLNIQWNPSSTASSCLQEDRRYIRTGDVMCTWRHDEPICILQRKWKEVLWFC